MEESYCVTLCGKEVGKVLVRRQGLYYSFSCRCTLPGDMIYRLMVTCGNIQESLGVPVPTDGRFVLEKKLPVKRIGSGNLSFVLVPKHEQKEIIYVPISPEEPFAYISRLKNAFLSQKEGCVGIYIEGMQEC